jgi:hypothetical protein
VCFHGQNTDGRAPAPSLISGRACENARALLPQRRFPAESRTRSIHSFR